MPRFSQFFLIIIFCFPSKILPKSDGKPVEQKPTKYSTREMVDKIIFDQQLIENPEGILQDIFYLATVLPSIHKGLYFAILPQNIPIMNHVKSNISEGSLPCSKPLADYEVTIIRARPTTMPD